MDQVDEVRRKIDIVELINDYLPLKKAGRNFRALCPFHQEKTPSFMVSQEMQIYKCFGCQNGGDAFKFLMEYEKMDFGEALRFLAKRAGIKLTAYQPSAEENKKQNYLAINHLASEFYHYLLLQHRVGSPARDYLKKRGLSLGTIKKFKLGYAPQMWDGLIRFLVNKKKYPAEDLEKTGLIIKKSTPHSSSLQSLVSSLYYDRFRARLMFPLNDHRGNILGFAGRTLDPEAKEAKYVNTPETLLYHKAQLLYGLDITKNEIKKANCAVIVEGEFDLLSSYQAGVQNVVAIKGSALTLDQAQLLRRFCENVILSLDADVAGDAASRRGLQIAEENDLNVKVATPLYGKDPDECVQKSPTLWHQSIKKAVNIYDFYFSSAFSRFDSQTPEGLKKISQDLLPLISQIKNKIVQNHYLRLFAVQTKVSEDAVIAEIQRHRQKAKVEPVKNQVKAQTKPQDRRQLLEEYFLSLLLHQESRQKLLMQLDQIPIQTPHLKKIFHLLQEFLAAKKELNLKAFFPTLPAELKEIVSALYLQEIPPGAKIEVTKIILELQKLNLKEQLQALAGQIKEAEIQKDDIALQTLQKEYQTTLSHFRKLQSS